jgi:hypothetical protein
MSVQPTVCPRILQPDWLAPLLQQFPTAQLEQLLLRAGCSCQRHRKWPPVTVLACALAYAAHPEQPWQDLWTHLHPEDPAPPCAAAWHYARERLGWRAVRQLFSQLASPQATPDTAHAFVAGLRLLALDGTTLNLPASAANARAFGYAKNQCGPSGYPLLRLVGLVEVGTHRLLEAHLGRGRASEVPLARRLVGHIPPGSLVLADRLFFGFRLIQAIRQQETHVLFRLKAGCYRLHCEQRLADGSYLRQIYPSAQARRQQRDGLPVRVIEYDWQSEGRRGARQRQRLLTTILDPQRLPASAAIAIYPQRWQQELVWRDLKETLLAGAVVPLRSRQPELVRQEVWALLTVHNLLRGLMNQAARPRRQDPLGLSYRRCGRVLRRQLLQRVEKAEDWYASLLERLSRCRKGRARSRSYPRKVKCPRCKWPRKKKKDRGGPRPPGHWTLIDHAA